MRSMRVILLCVGAMVLAACHDDKVILAPKVSLAYTRFVHAVSDTSAMDWRFVDQLENSPLALGLTFRGFTPYQGTGAGARHLRIFTTSTDINITSQVVIDTTYTFQAGTYYTIVHEGYARAGQTPADRLLIIEDKIPDVSAANIAIRAVQLGPDLGNVDLFASRKGGATPLPATPLFANLAYNAVSSYATLAPDTLALRVTAAGQRTPVMADAAAPVGAPRDSLANLTAIGGSTLPRSAFTAFVMPASVIGSAAPQTTAFRAPAIVYIIDRNPPRSP